VCLQPCWLCSNVIGQLLSLDFVAQARVTGCYTVDDFQVAFSECDALDILQVLEALQICTQASCMYCWPYVAFSCTMCT
jgi:death-associated protein kinase